MRVPISWLKEYVDVDMSPADLDSLLTNAGMEGVGLDIIGLEGADLVWDRELVLLAQVIKVERHPAAEKLVLATVEYGADEPKVVVTGAPNLFQYLDQGDLSERRLFSPMVLEGATYLDPYKDLKPRKLKGKPLRGIYNDAMLCSPEKELGISEEHEGIILIQKDSEHQPDYHGRHAAARRARRRRVGNRHHPQHRPLRLDGRRGPRVCRPHQPAHPLCRIIRRDDGRWGCRRAA